MSALATFDTGHWKEVARVDLEPEERVAVFQQAPDEAVRYLIFQRTPSGFWLCEHQSGHFETVEEAVADSVAARG
jgi:hypothetical protein